MMKTLNLSISGNYKPLTEVYVDGKRVSLKKKKKERLASLQTEKESVELEIKRYSRYNFKLWFFNELIFFILSIFGIFDQRFGNFYYETECKIQIPLTETNNNFSVRLAVPKHEGEVVRIEKGSVGEVVENKYIRNNVLAKRAKIMKGTKIATAILIIGAVIATLCVVLI